MDRVTTEETLLAAFQRVDSSHSCALAKICANQRGQKT
jgi:hypothetical protein